jgi:hypothetical protein
MAEIHATNGAVGPQRELGREQFNDLISRVIQTASDGTTVNDAICAMAMALGALISVTAERDGVSRDELLKFCLESVASCAALTDAAPPGEPEYALTPPH